MNEFKLTALLSSKFSIKTIYFHKSQEVEKLFNNDPFHPQSKIDSNLYTIFFKHKDLIFSIHIRFLLKDYFNFGYSSKILGDEDSFVLNKIKSHLMFLEYVVFDKSKSYTSNQEELFIENLCSLIEKEIANWKLIYDFCAVGFEIPIRSKVSHLFYKGLDPVDIYKKALLEIFEPHFDILSGEKLYTLFIQNLKH